MKRRETGRGVRRNGMTTNGKGVTKERLFAFVKETTALGKECGIVERGRPARPGTALPAPISDSPSLGWTCPAKTAGG